jgi:N-methylhydantoinase A
LRAIGKQEKPASKENPARSDRPPPRAILGKQRVAFKHRSLATAIYAREKLECGNRIAGPAIAVEYTSTTVVPPFAEVQVDGFRNLIMDIAS